MNVLEKHGPVGRHVMVPTDVIVIESEEGSPPLFLVSIRWVVHCSEQLEQSEAPEADRLLVLGTVPSLALPSPHTTYA